ncbi:hypothetical protein FM107_16420 [Sphingobacterium sp. JB170]|nr:hypothetical protein FM107_16420 [Sphingobacterium sp. JB170]
MRKKKKIVKTPLLDVKVHFRTFLLPFVTQFRKSSAGFRKLLGVFELLDVTLVT